MKLQEIYKIISEIKMLDDEMGAQDSRDLSTVKVLLCKLVSEIHTVKICLLILTILIVAGGVGSIISMISDLSYALS